MLKSIAKKILVVFISLYSLNQIIDQIKINGGWYGLFYGSFILSVFYWILKPILSIILFPINMITLNLSSWLIDIIIFYIWTLTFPMIRIGDWQFPGINIGSLIIFPYKFAGWQIYLVSAILLSLLLKFYRWLLN